MTSIRECRWIRITIAQASPRIPFITKKHFMAKSKKQPQTAPPPPPSNDNEKIIQAHRDADEDIRDDPDMDMGGPDDDLDEGELARLDNSNDDD